MEKKLKGEKRETQKVIITTKVVEMKSVDQQESDIDHSHATSSGSSNLR